MTDTQWADISEFQVPVNDSYPYGFICIRSNDGNHIDNKIQGNLAWCRSRLASGKLWATWSTTSTGPESTARRSSWRRSASLTRAWQS